MKRDGVEITGLVNVSENMPSDSLQVHSMKPRELLLSFWLRPQSATSESESKQS